MEIGRGFQHAHNSVKMCAVTHGHSPGGGGSQPICYHGAKRAYVPHTPLLSIVREDNNGVFFMYSKNNINL